MGIISWQKARSDVRCSYRNSDVLLVGLNRRLFQLERLWRCRAFSLNINKIEERLERNKTDMGLEFMPIFEGWAVDYDEEVNGANPEYQEVFANYWQILDEITAHSGQSVLEFGSGTGNLTEKLVAAGKTVYPVEPSPEMRDMAAKKDALQATSFFAGDMENFPLPPEPVDTIVSNLVFHHLTAEEKQKVLKEYNQILSIGGKIIFGDTMFLSQTVYDTYLRTEKEAGRQNLAADLEREYYPVISELDQYFQKSGFQTTYRQMNRFVWIVYAEKIMEAE